MKSKSKSIRLPLEAWRELEYAASLHGVLLNDEIKNRLAAAAVEVPPEVSAGQLSLLDGDEGAGAAKSRGAAL